HGTLANARLVPPARNRADVHWFDLVVPQAAKMLLPFLECMVFLRDGARLLHARAAFDEIQVIIGIRGKSRGASKLWQIILSPLHFQPLHFFDSLGDSLHRFSFGIAQRDTANLFLAREWILNRQLRVEAITPAPKPAHGLLASVDHFCKSGAMRLSIREFAFGLACDGFGMPLSRKSWPPFVRPNHVA